MASSYLSKMNKTVVSLHIVAFFIKLSSRSITYLSKLSKQSIN